MAEHNNISLMTPPYGAEYFENISQNSQQNKLTFVYWRRNVGNPIELFSLL